MARPRRIDFAGALHHVMARGIDGRNLLHSDQEKDGFSRVLEETVKRYSWRIHAFCLMSNHYHLLVETVEANLCRGMRHVNGSFAQLYNSRHERQGHLFQGRFKSKLVEKESYLLELCRYIAMNPVTAGLVTDPAQWRWSHYRRMAGLTDWPSWLFTGEILGVFSSKRRRAEELFRRFVARGRPLIDPDSEAIGGVVLGSPGFALRHRLESRPSNEIPRMQFTLEEAAWVRDGRLTARGIRAARQAQREGATLRSIAQAFGVHYSTISRKIRQLETVCDEAVGTLLPERPDPTVVAGKT